MIYFVYPIWQYTLSVPTCSFLDEYDLSGKTIYAFAANGGSRFADSIGRIQEAEPEATAIEGISLSDREVENAKDSVLFFAREHPFHTESSLVSDENEETGGAGQSGEPVKPSASGNTEEKESDDAMKMNVQIGKRSFTATLENNAAVSELVEMMRQGPVSIDMSDYSGFEKVGSLGKSLTVDNRQTTTAAGDIVLYNGSNIVMFYGSNSWSYTRIGHIDDLTGWEDALGNGNITAVFTIVE